MKKPILDPDHIASFRTGYDFQVNAPLRLDGEGAPFLKMARDRLTWISLAFLIAYALIGFRLLDISLLHSYFSRLVSLHRHLPPPNFDKITPTLSIHRANITDRNGIVLATNLPTVALFTRSPKLTLTPAIMAGLRRILPTLDAAELNAKLKGNRNFLYIDHNLTPKQQYEVNSLGIPGLEFEKSDHRVYPQSALFAHLIGRTDLDNKGISGIEHAFNEPLSQKETTPLRLSLDVRLQTIVHQELALAVNKYKAIGGVGIIMDVQTGEVLAMVSLPDFDPNDRGILPSDPRMFNRATKGLYEMGSTFKLFTLAAALDYGTALTSTRYDATRPLQIHDRTIHDDNPQKRWLSLPEILIYSSNIGAAQVALALGAAQQKAFLTKAGLLEISPIQLSETAKPQIPQIWRDINTATIAFGHGISVTPLHLISGVSALVNGGLYHPPTFSAVDPGEAIPSERIIKDKTSSQLRDMMRLVVLYGTGKTADIPGYLVGGKTGTAEKINKGKYQKNANLASFIAAFPINKPKYCILVMIDTPQDSKGLTQGAWTAAPVVNKIITQMVPIEKLLPFPSSGTE